MTQPDDRNALRVAICGSRFGRVYMAALEQAEGLEFAALLGRGSSRSRACAAHYGVSLFDGPDELPDDIDLACVVVPGRLNGGGGAELAQQLMARGLHVVQEHPLTQGELVSCLRAAQRHGTYYRLSNHYPEIAPVSTFITVARALAGDQPALFVDAMCSIVVLNPLLDVVGKALGRLRPWRLGAPVAPVPHEGRGPRRPYMSLDLSVADVPVSLRVQNQIHPANRDSFAHTLHRIALGTEGGSLVLADTHGPVLWFPRAHMPRDTDDAVRVDASPATSLDLPGARVLAPAIASLRTVVGHEWPAAIRRVLLDARRDILTGADHRPSGQYQLALCELTQELSARLGPPELLSDGEPRIEAGDATVAMAAALASTTSTPNNTRSTTCPTR